MSTSWRFTRRHYPANLWFRLIRRRDLEENAVRRRVHRDEAAVLFGEPHLPVLEAVDSVFEIGRRRKLDREAAEPRRARRRRRRALPCPGIQSEVVVVAARRDKTHTPDMAHHVKTDEVVVEAHCVLDVRDV